MNIIIWIVTGVIAGWLAGLVVKGSGFGIIGDFIIGLIGGVLMFAAFLLFFKYPLRHLSHPAGKS